MMMMTEKHGIAVLSQLILNTICCLWLHALMQVMNLKTRTEVIGYFLSQKIIHRLVLHYIMIHSFGPQLLFFFYRNKIFIITKQKGM